MALHIFTARGFEQLRSRLGGTAYWKLNPANAAKEQYVFLYHNANPYAAEMVGERPIHPDLHGQVFAVGEVRDIKLASPTSDVSGRCLVRFKSIAKFENPNLAWSGQRNPVRYSPNTGEFDPTILEWFKVREDLPLPPAMCDNTPLTISEARQRLSQSLGVPQSAVRITIET